MAEFTKQGSRSQYGEFRFSLSLRLSKADKHKRIAYSQVSGAAKQVDQTHKQSLEGNREEIPSDYMLCFFATFRGTVY